jgi:hypothetical protein
MLSYQPFAIKDEFITADDVLRFEVSPTTITTGNLIIVIIVFIIIVGSWAWPGAGPDPPSRPTDHTEMEHQARHPT